MKYVALALAAGLSLAAQTLKAMAHLPDTGQTRHFAAGDDSEHPNHPLAYAVNPGGTVTDGQL